MGNMGRIHFLTSAHDQALKAFHKAYGIRKQLFGPDSKKKTQQVADIMLGLLNLSKGNYKDISQLSLKLGAFPNVRKLNIFLRTLNRYKDFLIEPKKLEKEMLAAEKEAK